MKSRFVLVLVALVSVARAQPPPGPPPPPPPPGSGGNVVPPNALEAQRIAGTKLIEPDDATKREISRAGKDRTISSFKLCIAVDGKIASVRLLRSSGFPAYDQKIIDTIQGEWRYRPYMIQNKAVPVCTAVTFIYNQQPADPPPRLRLLKPGNGPRQVLRMTFTPGDTHDVVVDWKESTARGTPGALGAPETATMRYDIAYAVGDVTPDGDARIDLTYRKVALAATDAESRSVNDHLAKLAGTKARATVTARGLLTDFELAQDVPDRLYTVFDVDALRPIDESFPDEPVGVGASWQVERTITSGDVTFLLMTAYEVAAIAGSRVTIKFTQSQDGKSTGNALHGTNKGDAVIDLRDAVPSSVTLVETQDLETDTSTSKLAQHRTSTVKLTAR
ncbi:MAG TPA: energy transducer TonB [Kofleriaceae bacterium]|jgi:hypothetical protein